MTARSHPSLANTVSIRSLGHGQNGIVVAITGNRHDVARLAEIGLRKGVGITAIRNGATSIIKIEFQSICIRLASDIEILVKV